MGVSSELEVVEGGDSLAFPRRTSSIFHGSASESDRLICVHDVHCFLDDPFSKSVTSTSSKVPRWTTTSLNRGKDR